jgi:hypothetical protein
VDQFRSTGHGVGGSVTASTPERISGMENPEVDHQPSLSISGRVFTTLEHAWSQRVVGMVAVLFGIFDGRYLSILSLLLLLAIHRSKSLRGLSHVKQAFIYSLTFCLLFVVLWEGGEQWNRNRDNSALVKAISEAVTRAISGTVSTSQTIYVPAPTVKPSPAPAVQCVADQSRPYKCRTNDELIVLLAGEQSRLMSLAKDALLSLRAGLRLKPDQEGARIKDIHRYLAGRIRECCIDDLTKLREEAIERIGLPRMDLQEESDWKHFNSSLESYPHSYGLWPETICEYSPYLTKMEQLLDPTKPARVESCFPF